jgi:TolB-like protein
MLCPAGGGGIRVVVTDFGLARGGAGDAFSTNADGTGGLVGSPAYMAPEQVEGGNVDRAADIYALGVVMFEMLTGQVPFTGDSPVSCAVKRIQQPAPSPRLYLPDIDARWEQIILRCLERAPENRFASAADVVRALEGVEVAGPGFATTVAARGRRRARRRWPLLAVGAGVLALAAGALWYAHGRGAAPPAAAGEARPGEARRAIAILGFKNLSRRDDVAWLSTALAEMLTTEMGADGELRTIPGETLARMKKDLALDDAETYAPDTLARIHRNIRADYVVLGSYAPFGAQFRLDVRLQDTASGETLLQVSETGTEAELAALVERTGARLRDKLRVGQLGEGEVAIVHAAMPRNAQAARHYAEGLAKLRVFAASQAQKELERAIHLEPEFPQAHAALSEALDYLGYEARARDEARKAVELSGALPDAERLRVEGAYHLISGDAKQAAVTYRKLFERSPDDLEWGIRLAASLYATGDEEGGARVLEQVRALPDAADEPRIYLVLMQAAMAKTNFRELRELTAKLAASGAAREALSLVAEAKAIAATGLWFEGQLADAAASAAEARELSRRLGDRDGVAAAATTQGFVLTEMGRLAEARQAAQAALGAAEEVGSRRRVWLAEHVLARCDLFGGDLDGAMRRFEASRVAAEEVGSKLGVALGSWGLAVTHTARGELSRAEPIYERMALGVRLFAGRMNQPPFFYFHGMLHLARGDLDAAEARLGEALQLASSLGERLHAERSRLGLAEIDLARGRTREAEARARAAITGFELLGLGDDLALAQLTLARALLAERRGPDARHALAEAQAAAARTQSAPVRFALARVRGAALVHDGKQADALAAVSAPLEEAARAGYAGDALELRLVRVEALRAADNAAARAQASRERDAVEKEAALLGFGEVVRRAQALAKR